MSEPARESSQEATNQASAESFRWQTFFQHSHQPLFLLNRRRRVLFVNRAWEQETGLSLAQVRGRVCRRRPATASAEPEEAFLGACAPPVETLRGQGCRVRRRVPGLGHWWEIDFVPLQGAEGLLGILGTIHVIAAPHEAPFSLPEKLMALRDQQAARYRLADLEQGSALLQRLHQQARLASQTAVPILLEGEAGVGKQWLARAIHTASERRQRTFACLDAERLPALLIGEFLLGPRSRAMGLGTVYLREPAFLPREWQGRLAETLTLHENGEFPRLIVGMRCNPREDIRAGRLLEELYGAASTITLQVPPLRERLSELSRFIEIFLQRERQFQAHAVQEISAEALQVLRSYPWPGNLRSLQEVLAGVCRHARAERIELADLPFYLKQGPLPAERRLPLDTLLAQVEYRLITLAMKLTQNNHTRAAEILDIWRPRLMRRLEKFGIDPKS